MAFLERFRSTPVTNGVETESSKELYSKKTEFDKATVAIINDLDLEGRLELQDIDKKPFQERLSAWLAAELVKPLVKMGTNMGITEEYDKKFISKHINTLSFSANQEIATINHLRALDEAAMVVVSAIFSTCTDRYRFDIQDYLKDDSNNTNLIDNQGKRSIEFLIRPEWMGNFEARLSRYPDYIRENRPQETQAT